EEVSELHGCSLRQLRDQDQPEMTAAWRRPSDQRVNPSDQLTEDENRGSLTRDRATRASSSERWRPSTGEQTRRAARSPAFRGAPAPGRLLERWRWPARAPQACSRRSPPIATIHLGAPSRYRLRAVRNT